MPQGGAENGCRVYDFGGAGKPDKEYRVGDFKAKYGGELVSYGRNACLHARPRVAIGKLGCEGCRRLRRFAATGHLNSRRGQWKLTMSAPARRRKRASS